MRSISAMKPKVSGQVSCDPGINPHHSQIEAVVFRTEDFDPPLAPVHDPVFMDSAARIELGFRFAVAFFISGAGGQHLHNQLWRGVQLAVRPKYRRHPP